MIRMRPDRGIISNGAGICQMVGTPGGRQIAVGSGCFRLIFNRSSPQGVRGASLGGIKLMFTVPCMYQTPQSSECLPGLLTFDPGVVCAESCGARATNARRMAPTRNQENRRLIGWTSLFTQLKVRVQFRRLAPRGARRESTGVRTG